MVKDYCMINFAGLTHDHSLRRPNTEPLDDNDDSEDSLCSAIAILKRHPLYDCLVLVKKYRNCLAGHSLEFPIDWVREPERVPTNESAHHQHQEDRYDEHGMVSHETAPRGKCGRRRLVTRFLDGDDPMHQAAFLALRNSSSMSLASDCSGGQPQDETTSTTGGNSNESSQAQQSQQPDQEFQPFMSQLDDRGEQCSLVHVPINGLLDRLENYTRNGVAVDGRVYAFAMGLKTAERMMTTKSMKELQETPV